MQTKPIPRDGSINGIDVSHYQGDIDWNKVAADGIQFVFIKASEGLTWKDPNFFKNAAGAKAAGLTTFAYHFYTPKDDPDQQAQNFLDTIQGSGVSALAIDLEVNGLNWVLAPADKDGVLLGRFINKISQMGLRVILYATPDFLNKWFPGAVYIDLYDKWIAKWSATPPDTDWLFWQYSAFGKVNGIDGYVDLDYINGTAFKL